MSCFPAASARSSRDFSQPITRQHSQSWDLAPASAANERGTCLARGDGHLHRATRSAGWVKPPKTPQNRALAAAPGSSATQAGGVFELLGVLLAPRALGMLRAEVFGDGQACWKAGRVLELPSQPQSWCWWQAEAELLCAQPGAAPSRFVCTPCRTNTSK